MPVRIRERDLVMPALQAAAARAGGIILTTDLIIELTELFQPDGEDALILDGRQDTRFSQKVRNLVSHRTTATSMFVRGYAEYTGDGIKITEAGLNLLRQLPE